MSLKLKLGSNKASSPTDAAGAQHNATSPSASVSGSSIKLKLNVSQPPTPIGEPSAHPGFPPAIAEPASATASKKKRASKPKQDGAPRGKKRAAAAAADDDDATSPAAKRVAGAAPPAPGRKFSIKIGSIPQPREEAGKVAKISLAKRKQSGPKIVELKARGKVPPRPKGVGYDSEDSDTEKDPAIQQALVLRMEDGEDAEFLRQAIASGQMGSAWSSGDAEVSLKFVDKNYRRAVIKIRGRLYAAVLVDLPCIVESMKSFDRKGWWKVADIAQMLLVLGSCGTEEEAKTFTLPREVNKDNFQYAHGLTPPMHWVRKRRFRKRMNYNEIVNVEEEVDRLLKADLEWEQSGGTVTNHDFKDRTEQEQSTEAQDYDDEEDAEGEAIETVETDGIFQGDELEIDMQDDDLEAKMQAMFDEEDATDLVESPAPLVAPMASMSAAENGIEDSEATPYGTPIGIETQDEHESDERESDEDEDESGDEFDEDAAARAAERAQQMEEVADLEREVERARQKVQSMTNQLLRQREMQKLSALEEDLRIKKAAFGLEDGDD